MTSFPFATSLHVLPLLSRRVSSMSGWSSNKLTMSIRPRDAARCSGVVPEPGGCTPLGDMALYDKSNCTVSTLEGYDERGG